MRTAVAMVLLLVSCTHGRDTGGFRSILVAGGYTILTGNEAELVLTQCSHYAPEASGFWQPAPADISELERRLPAWLSRQSHGPSKEMQYFRQYVGVIHDGRRFIYLNAFPADSIRDDAEFYKQMKARNDPALAAWPSNFSEHHWREHAVMVCDGGNVYWGVEYDPLTKQFLNLDENGEA